MLALRYRRRIAVLFAPWMFILAVLYLAGLATLVVLWVDVPNLRERSLEQQVVPVMTQGERWLHSFVVLGMLGIWPAFWLESLVGWFGRPWNREYWPFHLRGLLFALLPPLRMCTRVPEMSGALWFPTTGWEVPDRHLRRDLTRAFSAPMLGIAVLILPVLAIEFFLQDQVARYPVLRNGLHLSTGLIWFAFAFEFLVMVSAAESKLQYCKQHWMDLVIILLPLLSFLRTVQFVRATRLARMTKVQQLTKMARVYRLRGVSTKVLRALIVFEIIHRLLRTTPEKQLLRLQTERQRLLQELEDLDQRIAAVEAMRSLEGQREGSRT